MRNKLLLFIILGLIAVLIFVRKPIEDIVPSDIQTNVNIHIKETEVIINTKNYNSRIHANIVFGDDSIDLFISSPLIIDKLYIEDSTNNNQTNLRYNDKIHYSLNFKSSKYINIEGNYYTILGCGVYSPELSPILYHYEKKKTEREKTQEHNQTDTPSLLQKNVIPLRHKVYAILYDKIINTRLYDKMTNRTLEKIPVVVKLKERLSSQNLFIYIPNKQEESIAFVFTDPSLDEPRIEMAQLYQAEKYQIEVIAENEDGKIARFNKSQLLVLELHKSSSNEYLLVARKRRVKDKKLISSHRELNKHATNFISLYEEMNPDFKKLYNDPNVMYE